jgi:hypothetical protein
MTKQHPNAKNNNNNKNKNKNKHNCAGVAKPNKDLNDMFMIPKQQTVMTQWLKPFVTEPETETETETERQPPASVPRHMIAKTKVKKLIQKKCHQKKTKMETTLKSMKIPLSGLSGLYLIPIEGGRPAHELPTRCGIDITDDNRDCRVFKFGRSNNDNRRCGTEHPPVYNNNPDHTFWVHIDEEFLPNAEAHIKRWCDDHNLRLKNAFHADGTTQCHELVILNPEQHKRLKSEYQYIHNSYKSMKDTFMKNHQETMKRFIESTMRSILPGMLQCTGDASASVPSMHPEIWEC